MKGPTGAKHDGRRLPPRRAAASSSRAGYAEDKALRLIHHQQRRRRRRPGQARRSLLMRGSGEETKVHGASSQLPRRRWQCAAIGIRWPQTDDAEFRRGSCVKAAPCAGSPFASACQRAVTTSQPWTAPRPVISVSAPPSTSVSGCGRGPACLTRLPSEDGGAPASSTTARRALRFVAASRGGGGTSRQTALLGCRSGRRAGAVECAAAGGRAQRGGGGLISVEAHGHGAARVRRRAPGLVQLSG